MKRNPTFRKTSYCCSNKNKPDLNTRKDQIRWQASQQDKARKEFREKMESISLSLPPVDIPQIDLDSRLIDNDYTPKMGVIVITTDDIEAIVALCEEQGATTPAKIAKIAKEYIDTHYLSDIK